MATWVTHLMIADGVLNRFPQLDRRGFCAGNIAPDCNLENADWTAFTPSREVTHWMRGERKNASDCDGFYEAYIAKYHGDLFGEEYAFLLGYYAHLITDAAFQKMIRDPERVKAVWGRIKADAQLAMDSVGMEESWDSAKRLVPYQKRMQEIYSMEAEYLREHPDSGYLTEILPLKEFPDYIDYLPEGSIVRKIGVMGYLPAAGDTATSMITISREEYVGFAKHAIDMIARQFIQKGLLPRESREKIMRNYMGKTVRIIVDRPVGYIHGDIVYPINYGYLPGVIAGDGEEQDAYVLGVKDPLTEFTGLVIGAVRRTNDNEDKLVVAPLGARYHQGEIAEAVHFQEQYFDSTIDSLFRKSCGVIPFRWNGGEKEFLVLLQTNHSWSFPKGHMEAGETEQRTALRELFEETGLRASLMPEKKAVLEYDIPPYTRKQVVLFLGEVEGTVQEQKTEIANHRWVKAAQIREYLHPDTCEACAELLR